MLNQNRSFIAGDDLMQGLLWGTLEVTTAFVIACMPATRLFVQHFFPVLATKITAAVSTGRSKRTARQGFSTITSDEERGGTRGSRAVSYGHHRHGLAKTLAGSTLTDENDLEGFDLVPLDTLEEERRMELQYSRY